MIANMVFGQETRASIWARWDRGAGFHWHRWNDEYPNYLYGAIGCGVVVIYYNINTNPDCKHAGVEIREPKSAYYGKWLSHGFCLSCIRSWLGVASGVEEARQKMLRKVEDSRTNG